MWQRHDMGRSDIYGQAQWQGTAEASFEGSAVQHQQRIIHSYLSIAETSHTPTQIYQTYVLLCLLSTYANWPSHASHAFSQVQETCSGAAGCTHLTTTRRPALLQIIGAAADSRGRRCMSVTVRLRADHARRITRCDSHASQHAAT